MKAAASDREIIAPSAHAGRSCRQATEFMPLSLVPPLFQCTVLFTVVPCYFNFETVSIRTWYRSDHGLIEVRSIPQHAARRSPRKSGSM